MPGTALLGLRLRAGAHPVVGCRAGGCQGWVAVGLVCCPRQYTGQYRRAQSRPEGLGRLVVGLGRNAVGCCRAAVGWLLMAAGALADCCMAVVWLLCGCYKAAVQLSFSAAG